MKKTTSKIVKVMLAILLLVIGNTINAHNLEPLHVDGRYLKNSKGDIVTLHGYMSSLEPAFQTEEYSSGYDTYDVTTVLKNKKAVTDRLLASGWKMNYVRLKLLDAHWCYDQLMYNDDEECKNFDFSRFKRYFEGLCLPLIDYYHEKGIYTLLWPPTGSPSTIEVGDEYQQYLLLLWDYVSNHPRIRNNPGVMFELANEPVFFNCQQENNYGCTVFKEVRDYWQPIVDKIRSNCDNIIYVPGLAFQSYYTGFVDYPIIGDNVGYAVHWYPGTDVRDDWEKNVFPVAYMAPVVITETAWYDGNFYLDGEVGTTSKFGKPLKSVVDELGNVSWNCYEPVEDWYYLVTESTTQQDYKDQSKVSMVNNPEVCFLPMYQWWNEYESTKVMPTSRLKAKSVSFNEFPTTVFPGRQWLAKIKAEFTNGQTWDVSGDVEYIISDESVLSIKHGVIRGLREGSTNVMVKYTDGTGQTFSHQYDVTCTLFPLTEKGFNPNLHFEGSFDEATGTFSSESYNTGGWSFSDGLDLTPYKKLVVQLNHEQQCWAKVRIWDDENIWSENQAWDDNTGDTGLPFNNATELVIDLQSLHKQNGEPLDLSHIFHVGIWINGAAGSVSIKRVFLSNDGATVAYQEPTRVYADNKVMHYGDEIPALTFSTAGSAVINTPEVSTTATKTSSVGMYHISAEGHDEGVDYYSGNLYVIPAPLTVSTENKSILEGEKIPEFTLVYNGLKNNDTEETSIITKPVAHAQNTAGWAIAGSYPILVDSKGEVVENYMLTYDNTGILTVNESEEIKQCLDLTGRVGTSQDKWHAGGICSTQYAPAVSINDGRQAQMMEVWKGTADTTGEIMYQTISGLPNGEYLIGVYANALNNSYVQGLTFGDIVYDMVSIIANDVRIYIPAYKADFVHENGVYGIRTQVTDGTLRVSMVAEKPGTNWHTIQIKKLIKLCEPDQEPIYKVGDDITSLATADWEGKTGDYGGLANASVERYTHGTPADMDDILTQTVSGLENGTYRVQLEAAASFTPERGFDCPTGDGLSVVFANNTQRNLPVLERGWVGEGEQKLVTLTATVTDGTLKYGIKNRALSGNWFVARLKSIVYVSTEAQSPKTYAISIATEENGKTTTDVTADEEGSRVFITATPDEDCTLESLKVTTTGGKELEVTGNSFIMPTSDVKVTASYTLPKPPFELATETVKNIKIGWNLTNTLDAHGGTGEGVDWSPEQYETYWGQPVTTPELIAMVKNAGFNAIRVPVTWKFHTDESGNIDPAWMKRVHEVVDYVVDQDMYCILNTHHDTGATSGDQVKLLASAENYQANKDWFENVWRQIATEFKDYDHRLIFEGYNEMRDIYDGWFIPNGEHGEAHVAEAYKAVNDYAQSFVDAVRSTGGNNAVRNLMVNTYSALIGPGVLGGGARNMVIPTDAATGHIIAGVHGYSMDNPECVDDEMECLKECFLSKGVPVIVGEWWNPGDDWNVDVSWLNGTYRFIQQSKENDIAIFLWDHILLQGKHRILPIVNDTEFLNNLMHQYYGEDFEPQILSEYDYDFDGAKVTYKDVWAEFALLNQGRHYSLNDYVGITVEVDNPESVKLRALSTIADKSQYFDFTSTESHTFYFDKAILGDSLATITIQNIIDGINIVTINNAWLIRKDGTREQLTALKDYDIWHTCTFDILATRKTDYGQDLTALVGTSQQDWHAQGLCDTNYAPTITTSDKRSVPMAEINEGTTENTGELMWQEVTGLPNGNYRVELYANAMCIGKSILKGGADNVVFLNANGSIQWMKAYIGTEVGYNGNYSINTEVTDGKLRISMVAEKTGTNWHTIQIKRLVKINDIAPATRTPFDGETSLPGILEAENYDVGGEGITYHDNEPENQGDGNYRQDEGVDIVAGNGGYAVGFTETDGEWMEYVVNVKKAGKYTYEAIVSSGVEGTGFRISLVGKDGGLITLANISVPKTGDWWDIYQSVKGDLLRELQTGSQIIRITITSGGCNIDRVKFDLKSEQHTLLGDVNGDGEINVADIVEVVNYILGRPSDIFMWDAADLNGDGEVNVTDIVAIVNIILTADVSSAKMRGIVEVENTENDMVALFQKSNSVSSLELTNEGKYVASQFDLVLAEGQRLNSITLNEKRANDHSVSYSKVGENTYRVVVYSLSNTAYEGSEGELLNIDVTGDGEYSLENILFVTAQQVEKRFAPLAGEATGINSTVAEKTFDIYSVDGILLYKQATTTEGLPKGVYIIEGKKYLVK